MIQIVQCKTASATINFINSSPQTERTTFSFSSVFILLLCPNPSQQEAAPFNMCLCKLLFKNIVIIITQEERRTEWLHLQYNHLIPNHTPLLPPPPPPSPQYVNRWYSWYQVSISGMVSTLYLGVGGCVCVSV